MNTLPCQCTGRLLGLLLGFLGVGCFVQQGYGQWASQSVTLNPGWTAIFLEVQPANDDCDALFSALPIESVWAWNRRFSSLQFIQDANKLVPGQPDWLTYLPPDSPGRASRNLYTIQGGASYLIKLKSGASAVNWNIAGKPVVRPIDWLPDSLNFVGFSLAAGAAPTFQSFFSGSSSLSGQPVYRLSAAGQWILVSNPSTIALQRGESFWIRCQGASSFSGPVQLTVPQADGLPYGRSLTEQTVRIRNASTTSRVVTVREIASLTPPDTNSPVLAGPVPLSYFVMDATNRVFGWVPLPAQLQKSLAAGEEWVLRLEVNRAKMAPFTPPPVHNGVLYQSILQIGDSTGVRSQIAVTSEGLTSYPATSKTESHSGSLVYKDPPDPRAGLWIGSATLSKVSQPSSITASNTPVSVGTPLQFRLLVHVDENGNARLLRKVLEMFKPAVLSPDPNNPSNSIVDVPGHYVLVTDDSLIPNFTGAALRDNQPVGRRLSSVVFGFGQPILLAGTGAFGSGTFGCDVSLAYDDPLNPFKHRYHPDHDNLDDRFQNRLPEGVESFSVNRRIQLEFTAQDPDNLTLPGWGDARLGGNYTETILGLQSTPIYVSGTFRLMRTSAVGVLNDGL